jgi:hypothetical protein
VTREYYLRFFDVLELKEGCALKERCDYFAKIGKNDPIWAFSNILRYIHSEKNREEKKQIT